MTRTRPRASPVTEVSAPADVPRPQTVGLRPRIASRHGRTATVRSVIFRSGHTLALASMYLPAVRRDARARRLRAGVGSLYRMAPRRSRCTSVERRRARDVSLLAATKQRQAVCICTAFGQVRAAQACFMVGVDRGLPCRVKKYNSQESVVDAATLPTPRIASLRQSPSRRAWRFPLQH